MMDYRISFLECLFNFFEDLIKCVQNVEIVDPTMGGEDFSEYSLPDRSIPAVNFHFGAVDPAKIAESKQAGKELPTLHSSKFAPVPEPTIRVGIIGMTSAVLELMKN